MYTKRKFKYINKISSSLASARKKGSSIKKIPLDIVNDIHLCEQIKTFAESKLEWEPIGFKVGATNKKIMKFLSAEEPFFSYIFKEQTIKNNKKFKLIPNQLGIELEIAYKINKKIFTNKIKKKKQLKSYIMALAPAFEFVGFRQKINKPDKVGRAIIDFGLNISFLKSSSKKINNPLNFTSRTEVTNLKNNKIYIGHTRNVLGNPINSLYWLINQLKQKNISLKKDFWVTTGSTTPIIPVKRGDIFRGDIPSLGKVLVKF